MYISTGDRIVLLRKKRKLSQEQLAKKLDIPLKDLTEYENDKVSPAFNVAVKMADALDVSLDFLACRIDQQVDTKWLAMAVDIQQMTEKNQQAVIELIDAFINYNKVKNIYAES
jgi:transcriptional regulator with XRE-family HTH domain